MRKFFTIAIIALSINAFAQIPSSGLVGWYPFNGNTNDESINGNNGTNNGAILTADRFGSSNSAYNFNGTSNYISVPNIAVQGANSRTISFWIKTNSNIAGSMVISTGTDADVNGGDFNLRLENSNKYIGFMGGNYTAGGYDYYPTGNIVLNDNLWHNVLVTYNGTTINFYIDGVFEKSTNKTLATNGQANYIGKSNDWRPTNAAWYIGLIDDVGYWNRVLTPSEITAVYNYTPCSDTTVNDTQTIYVSDANFQSISPKTYFEGTDSLTTTVGGCDSIVNRYTHYVFQANYCTDTVHITVTDTLIINANLVSISPLIYQNTIKVYPNPTSDHITIDFGSNYSTMNGYTLKITNSLSQIVYTTSINTQSTTVDLSTWTGNGIYFVHLIDASSNTIDIRKIVLQ